MSKLPWVIECIVLFFGALFNRVLIIFTIIASGAMAYAFPQCVLRKLPQYHDVSAEAVAKLYLIFHCSQFIGLLGLILIFKWGINRPRPIFATK